jgi:signal transduction histidine kinase
MLGVPAHAIVAQKLAAWVDEPPEKLHHYLQNCARSRQTVPGKLTFIAPPDKPNRTDNPRTYRCDGAVVEPRSDTTPALVLLRLRLEESAAERFLLLNRNIDDLNREVRERRHAEAHLRLLAEVSTTLADTLEHRSLLQKLAEQIVGHFADWCMVYLLDANLHPERVATAHVNPTKQAWARHLTRHSPNYDVPTSIQHVMESGKSLFLPDYAAYAQQRPPTESEYASIIRRINPKSVITVPLHARHRTLGAVALVWSESDRQYTQRDLEFAEELAHRTALVLENTRLYQEARTAETQLREFNQSLEVLVAERTFELARSNEELDQFAYVASHDLRAPLRAITHLTHWLEEDSGDALPTVARGHIDKMRGRLARMERLLDDLLTYARAGRQNHAPEEVDSAALVHNLVDMLAPPAGFQIHVADTLPLLHTERVPLETVLRNLINNAIKHHDNPAHGQVAISAYLNGSKVEFVVADNGPGIAPQFHARIFAIFQALKPRDQVEGSGIGLAVVKKIVENRGGTILVQSDIGAGATFRFTWPVST